MTKLRLVIALLLAIPFAAFSASFQQDAAADTAPAGIVVEDAGSSYECCWIFFAGNYWCVPC